MENNPMLTQKNSLARESGKQRITEPFCLPMSFAHLRASHG
jgi:hypothetical protein